MTAQVSVNFGKSREFEYRVERSLEHDVARGWLEDQYVALGAEPFRLSGKILLADKVLAVAAAAGADLFEHEQEWARKYATVVACVLQRDVVRVDIAGETIGY